MRALIFAVAAAMALGCHDLTPKQQRALDVFECRVNALAPFVPTVLDLEAVARDVIAGKADLGAILEGLGALREDVESAKAAWEACNPSVSAPAEAPKGSVL